MKERVGGGGQSRTVSDRLLMQRASTLLAADLSFGELFERLTQMLAQYIDASVVFVALALPDGRNTIEYFYDHGEIRRFPHIELSETARARAVIASGEIIWGNDPSEWAPTGRSPINADRPWTDDSRSAMFLPMRSAGSTLGCLSVQSTTAGAYDQHHVEVVAALAHYLGVALQNQRMYQTLQRTAELDRLTGISNHSKLSSEFDAALAQASSTHPVAAIMLNVVNFAMFNDEYGHAEGDVVLQRITTVLIEFEDDQVFVGRFGGDIFMVLVTGATSEKIEALVANLSARLSELSYSVDDQTIPISVACGYVVAPLHGGSRHDLVALCGHRTRLSRKQACRPVGSDDIDAYTLHGSFAGIETIVEGLLDRDPYTRVHLFQVNTMAKLWSEFNLDLDTATLATLLQASLLHDVGKLLISDRILVKPGRLSIEEYLAAQHHAIYGRDILARHAGFEEVAQIVGQHHERWDGAGYPQGLRGEQIHPLARAIAILDALSAMVADRPYHRGISEPLALAEIERCSGTQFDPELTAKFIAWRVDGAPPQLA